MADTLRSLAGDKIFKPADVITALHTPLTPEELVLDRYVFLPHARTGIAAALDTPFDVDAAGARQRRTCACRSSTIAAASTPR